MVKSFYFTVQIRKSKIIILQKEWGKELFLLFKIKKKATFESH